MYLHQSYWVKKNVFALKLLTYFQHLIRCRSAVLFQTHSSYFNTTWRWHTPSSLNFTNSSAVFSTSDKRVLHFANIIRNITYLHGVSNLISATISCCIIIVLSNVHSHVCLCACVCVCLSFCVCISIGLYHTDRYGAAEGLHHCRYRISPSKHHKHHKKRR